MAGRREEAFSESLPRLLLPRGPRKRVLLRRVPRRYLRAVIGISRNVAKKSMGFIFDRFDICRCIDAVLGGRDVFISTEIGLQYRNVLKSTKERQ